MNVTCETANDAAHEQPQVPGEDLAEADRRERTPAIPAPLGSGSIALAALGSALFALTSVCAMRLMLHRAITHGDWLTGLCAAALTAAFTFVAGRALVRRMLRTRQQLIESDERIRGLAHFDAVTGLPNRILLKDRVRRELSAAARNQTPLAFLFLVLDRFKDVNDSVGHQAGDELLRTLGERLEQSLRDVDTAARLGGDEFVVILPYTDASGAAEVADKLRLAIGRPHSLDGRPIAVTPSIGISMYPGDGMDMDSLMRHAHTAMHQARTDGANSFRFFRSQAPRTMQQSARNRAEEIGRALRNDEFTIDYQAQVDVHTGAIVAVEAQFGWNHPDLGQLGAREFIPLAATCGLLEPLAEWYLLQASRQLASWHASGLLDTPLALHLSGQQFCLPSLASLMQRVLLETGLEPCHWELELSEGSLNDVPADVMKRLLAFRHYGMHFAIREFGTSHNGLASIKSLPATKLKADPAFVEDLPRNQLDAIIVTSMIDLAHNLGKKFVADGVSSRAQLKFLRARGCDIAQGPVHGKPADAAAFTRTLQPLGKVSSDSVTPAAS